MVTSAKSSVPTVTDQAAAMQLGQCAKNLATCLAELRTSAQKVEHKKITARCIFMHKQTLEHALGHKQTLYFTQDNNFTASLFQNGFVSVSCLLCITSLVVKSMMPKN